MPDIFAFTLPLPPSANRYWRHNRGRTHLSTEALAFREVVKDACLGPRPSMPWFGAKARLVVSIDLVTGRRRRTRGDVDNYLKVLLDAMQGVVYPSDHAIDDLRIQRVQRKGVVTPFVNVTVSEGPAWREVT